MAASRADGFVIGFTTMCAALLLSFCRDASENFRGILGSAKNTSSFHSDLLLHTTLSSDMRAAVAKRCAELEKLLQSPDVEKFVLAAHSPKEPAGAEEIKALEEKWLQASAGDDPALSISKNDCSQQLAAFQNGHPAFAEIFITDVRGFNICETNKTTDYYQADEGWWNEGYSNGKGRTGFGAIEFDQSAGMEAIPLHLPVYNSQTHEVIGVAKGVLNLTRVIAEL